MVSTGAKIGFGVVGLVVVVGGGWAALSATSNKDATPKAVTVGLI